jgi:Arc/MetJ family transcription regulator
MHGDAPFQSCKIHKNVGSLHITTLSKMRTNIDIDDRLMRQAMCSSRARTKLTTAVDQFVQR